MNEIKAIIKQIKSYFKADWDFDDYPTETWEILNAGENEARYGAGIINWAMMVERGETPEKALAALKDDFTLYKNNNNQLPRPGTKVPIKFASTGNIEKYEKTAADFFEKVLNTDYYDGFYSDGSILAYFEPGNDEEKARRMREEIIRKILVLYNVDISYIYDEPLWRIFERIDNKK
jgi:hypothetical protein